MQTHTIAALSFCSVINEEGMSVSLVNARQVILFLSFSHRISQDVFFLLIASQDRSDKNPCVAFQKLAWQNSPFNARSSKSFATP